MTKNAKDMVMLVRRVKLNAANTQSKSLRMTLPLQILQMWGLKEGDEIEIRAEIGATMTVTLHPVKKVEEKKQE